MKYSVNYWCSHPSAGNDDCCFGYDFDTLEEAEEGFTKPVHKDYIACIELAKGTREGDASIHARTLKVRDNPEHKKSVEDDGDEWLKEAAMQAGMAFGCDGFNEAMGYDCE